MSALQDDAIPAAPGRRYGLRFARPAWEREPGVTWEPLPGTTSPAPLPDATRLPVPDALAPYVRSERHFQLVIRAVLSRVGHESPSPNLAPPYRGARLACARRVLRLLGEAPDDPSVLDLLLLLFPPVACGMCGRPFLQENERRVHCSDRCRYKAQYAAARAKAVRGPGAAGRGAA